jgi:hypothetical protein
MFESDIFTLSEVRPNIFFLNFDDHYQLAMHFVRYQEFYESPNSIFRGQSFTLIDFMEWYSEAYGDGIFTYPQDWEGFNIPSNIIPDVQRARIKDFNKYDEEMIRAWTECRNRCKGDFYIIGAVGESSVLDHEIAHGLYYTNVQYNLKAHKLYEELPQDIQDKMCEVLISLGYASKVLEDETQAYLATGIDENLFPFINGEEKPFIELYSEYSKV